MSQKLQLTFNEYERLVEIGRRVNIVADDINERDQKKKFLMRGFPPTVEQLVDHNVFDNFQEYLPLLVYFYEDELYKGEITPEYRELKHFLSKLFAEYLELVDQEEMTRHCVVPQAFR